MMAVDTQVEAKMALETANRNTERIAGLEAGYQYLATKADIEKLRADIEKLRADLTWRIVIAMSILTAIFVAIVRMQPSSV